MFTFKNDVEIFLCFGVRILILVGFTAAYPRHGVILIQGEGISLL